MHRIVAVVDDAPNLGLALADMGAAGIDQERQRIVDILRARGGHHLLHFRRWTIEEIRRPHDHHGEHDGQD